MNKHFCIISSFIFLLGCSIYSFKGSIPVHIKSISVNPVINESTEFGINEKIGERIMDILISENVLDVTNDNMADSRLNIIVTRVDDSPYTYTLSDNTSLENVEEYRITIYIKAIWYDINRDEPLFDINRNSWGAYGTSLDISDDDIDNDGDGLIDDEDEDEFGSPRESAIILAVKKISEDIINELTSTW